MQTLWVITMKIGSRGHRLSIYIVKRNTKTDGMGPYKYMALSYPDDLPE